MMPTILTTSILIAALGAGGNVASALSKAPARVSNGNNVRTPTRSPLPVLGRRRVLSFGPALLAFGASVAPPAAPLLPQQQSAWAFDNAVADYATYAGKPKRRGDVPMGLGVGPRTIIVGEDADAASVQGLKPCDGKPHCFSTTGDEDLEERLSKGVDTLIPPWVPPASDKYPLRTLAAAVRAYEPGQGGVDGGGFSVVSASDSYVYAQFESLKKSYIDDVEFALAPEQGAALTVLVRSSSRVGYSDLGVNAKRLNALAKALREDHGWAIKDITAQTHGDYFDPSQGSNMSA